jgi:hypothetical protein
VLGDQSHKLLFKIVYLKRAGSLNNVITGKGIKDDEK